MDDTIFHRVRLGARLCIRGDDAAAFLQGQFSNDLRRSEPCPATYGLWLNHKGRVLADSHVLQYAPNEFEIISRTSVGAVIRARLESYIIADDVQVEDLGAGGAAVVVAGARADDAARELGLAVTSTRRFATRDDLVLVPARCDAGTSWMIVGPETSIAQCAAALERLGLVEADHAGLEYRRILAGLPAVPDELGPDDLPMEGGLEHDAISFTKGCYLGQEVMARLHNLGQVRRRLFLVRSEPGAGLPARGEGLFLGAQRVGEMRSAVPSADVSARDVIGLAMLQAHAVQAGVALAVAAEVAPCVKVERLAEGHAP